ncbi:MAG: tetratricopeptide repeat protein [Bernardetiaceae bacterium]|jgi:tetratricopeptide (TPR) repeat protein|nr:tetratricopeptide repeat protein [Bernardetiaceae bacterium]
MNIGIRLTVVALWLLSQVARAQSPPVDSLLRIMRQLPDDEQKVYLLHQLSVEHAEANLIDAYSYGEAALAVAQKTGSVWGQVLAHHRLGMVRLAQGQLANAQRHFENAQELARQATLPQGELLALHGQAMINKRKGNYDLALQQFEKCLEMALRPGLPTEQLTKLGFQPLKTLLDIGNLYAYQGNYYQAINYYTDFLNRLGENSQDHQYLALVYNHLADVYRRQGHYSLALAHYQRSLGHDRARRSLRGTAIALARIGSTYNAMERYDEALRNLDTARFALAQSGNRPELASAIFAIGQAYLAKQDLMQSEQNHREALAIREDIGLKQGQVESWVALAQVKLAQQQPTEALRYAQTAQQLATQLRAQPELLAVYEVQAAALAQQKNFAQAYQLQGRVLALRDSLDKASLRRQVDQLRQNQDRTNQKREQERDALLSQMVQAQNQHQQNLYWFGLALIGCLLGLAYLVYRLRRREQLLARKVARINHTLDELVTFRTAQLEARTRQIEEFAAKNSRQLRAPLATLLGLANLIEDEPATPPQDQQQLVHYMKDSAQEMDRVIHQISKILSEDEARG